MIDKLKKFERKVKDTVGYQYSKIEKDIELMQYINMNTPEEIQEYSTKAKLNYILNNLTIINIKCKNKECSKVVKFQKECNKFGMYCSKKCSASSEESKLKTKQTNLKRYGNEFNARRPEARDKMKRTMISRYGENNSMKVQKFKDKWKRTLINNHGVEVPYKSSLIKEKGQRTLIDNYGINNPMKSEEIKEKFKRTLNLNSFNHKEHFKNKEFINDKEFIIENFINENNQLLFKSFQEFFGCSLTTVYNTIYRLGITFSRSFNTSFKEKEILQYIKEILPGISILENTRKIIPPLELDIYIPELNIAIEYNGLYWHSLEKEDSLNQKYKHHKKSIMCLDKGIRLIHIYEGKEEEFFEEFFNILEDNMYVKIDNNKINLDYGLPVNSIITDNINWGQPEQICNIEFKIYNAGYLLPN